MGRGPRGNGVAPAGSVGPHPPRGRFPCAVVTVILGNRAGTGKTAAVTVLAPDPGRILIGVPVTRVRARDAAFRIALDEADHVRRAVREACRNAGLAGDLPV